VSGAEKIMRIDIDIDGERATSIDQEPPSAPAEPPPEVLMAAEKVGAFSAGPAPVRFVLEARARGLRDAPRPSPVTSEDAAPVPAAGASGRVSRKKTKRARKANT
jgi:hypothetical protein